MSQAVASFGVCAVVCSCIAFLVPGAANKKTLRILTALTLTVAAVTPFVSGAVVLEGIELINGDIASQEYEIASEALNERLRLQAEEAVENKLVSIAYEMGVSGCSVKVFSEEPDGGGINITGVRIYITGASEESKTAYASEVERLTGLKPEIVNAEMKNE